MHIISYIVHHHTDYIIGYTNYQTFSCFQLFFLWWTSFCILLYCIPGFRGSLSALFTESVRITVLVFELFSIAACMRSFMLVLWLSRFLKYVRPVFVFCRLRKQTVRDYEQCYLPTMSLSYPHKPYSHCQHLPRPSQSGTRPEQWYSSSRMYQSQLSQCFPSIFFISRILAVCWDGLTG